MTRVVALFALLAASGCATLVRGYAHLLVVSKDGYGTEYVNIRSVTSDGWMAVGILTPGISAVIDMALGGIYDLKPERVHVVLERESAAGVLP